MASSRLLVISSCTGDKAVNTPAELKLEDFADADRLKRREHELASYRRPASVMYTGKQHEYLMRGVPIITLSGTFEGIGDWRSKYDGAQLVVRLSSAIWSETRFLGPRAGCVGSSTVATVAAGEPFASVVR